MTVQLGSSGTRPIGNTTPDLGGFNFFTAGAWWQELGRTVISDKLAPNSSTLISSFGAGATLQIGWFGSTYKGVNSLYTTPFNVAPSTQPLLPLTLGVYASQSDPGPVPFYPAMSIQGWPANASGGSYFDGTIAVTVGSPIVTGTSSHFDTQIQAGDLIMLGYNPATFTVLSIQNATHLTLTTNYSGSLGTDNRIWGPFNRPPAPTQLAGDHHGFVMLRNVATTGVSKLYEYYQVESSDGGATWLSAGGATFDIVSGATRTEGWTSADAAGLPMMPIQVMYPEVASGQINHPLRLVIGTGVSYNREVWPARHAVNTGSNVSGLPMGSRLRISQSWYAANRASFSTLNRTIIDCLHTYGGIVADLTGGGLVLDGVNDDRWDPTDLLVLQSIPITAFEVVDTIKSPLRWTCQSYGVTGVARTVTVNYLNASNTNFGGSWYGYYSTDGGATFTNFDSVVIDDTHVSPTMSFTPPSDGSYLLKLVTSFLDWIEPAQLAFTAKSSVSTITSTANGNWASGATWVGGIAPGPGDKAIVNHNVTITADTTIGDGTNSTVLDVTNGTLTVTGAVLTIAGNSTFGKYTGSAPVARLTVQHSGATPAGIELDGNSGVSPTMTLSDDTLTVFAGSSSARVFLRTRLASPGNFGYCADASSLHGNYWQVSYCDFSRLGDTSHQALTALNVTGGGTAPIFSFDNCTVDNCSTLPYLNTQGGNVTLSFTNSVWTNAINSNPQNYGTVSLFIASTDAITTGTRLVNKCNFFNVAVLYTPLGYTVTQNYFDQALTTFGTGYEWALFDSNFVRKVTESFETRVAGSISNSYFLDDNPAATGAMIAILGSNTANAAIAFNVIQPNHPTAGLAFNETEGAPNFHTDSLLNNLVLANTGGGPSYQLGGADANTVQSFYPSFVAEHNTVCMNGSVGCAAGATIGQRAGTVLSFRSNIFYNTGTPSFALQNQDPAPVNDIVTAAHCDYNAWLGLATVPPGTWNDISDGTVYSTPITGATPPGVHDIVSVDPLFVDPSRNLQAWAVHKGYAASSDSNLNKVLFALRAIQADTTLVASDLLVWVRAGFQPTNGTIQNAGHDGVTIGSEPFSGGGPASSAATISKTEPHDLASIIGTFSPVGSGSTEPRSRRPGAGPTKQVAAGIGW